MKSIILKVNGMSCEHCVDAITKALFELEGVINATINLDEREVSIDYDSNIVIQKKIEEAIEEEGYDIVTY